MSRPDGRPALLAALLLTVGAMLSPSDAQDGESLKFQQDCRDGKENGGLNLVFYGDSVRRETVRGGRFPQ